MPDEILDVKKDAPSSEASANAGGQREDVIGASSASQESNSTQGDKANELSLNEFVKQHIKEQGHEVESSDAKEDEVEKKKLDSKIEPNQEEKEKEKVDDEKEEVVEEDKGEKEEEKEKGPIPYERFQEKVHETETLKQRLATYEPAVKNYQNIVDFCRKFEITAKQHEDAMRIQALLNTDPERALKEILPLVEKLQGFVGNKLPGDLQQKVDEGKMEIEDAKEMARLRSQDKFREGKLKRDKESMQQERYIELKRQLETDVADWETRKRKLDPDYQPKAKDSDSDGKWEMVRDKYIAWVHQTDDKGNYVNPIQSSKDAVSLQEKAYDAVNNLFKRFTGNGKGPTKKHLTSNGSSTTSNNEKSVESAPTMREGIRRYLDQSAGKR